MYVRCNNEIRNLGRYFGPLIFDKFKMDVFFEVIVIDTTKPTGQCILEDFRTLKFVLEA